jgi:hypothetical protein
MTITEPVTLITDYILGVSAAVFAALLLAGGPPGKPTLLWILGFAAGAIAAFVGGTFHGFASYMSESSRRSLWNVTLLSIGASSAFLIAAALSGTLDRHLATTTWMKWGLGLSVAGLAIQASGFRHGHNFNHNDLFHVIQTVALYCFYRGAAGR